MCGIGGIQNGSKEMATNMGHAIAHRGPDFEGTWSNESFALSHRLLSIRSDAARSQQPWMEKGQPWVLVYNGQIYNTKEVKKIISSEYSNEELDTALLYALIKKKGWNFISHIQGMFAIGLYNVEEKTLKLYRDQSGQKNIYYTRGLPQFAFCSEIKGILETIHIQRKADIEGVMVAMSLGYLPGNRTIFEHIRKVRPGEIVTYREGLDVVSEFYNSHSTYLDKLTEKEAIAQTIQDHLASKQKVALNLSGGMDSSALLHEMKNVGYKTHTYTTRFTNSDEKLNRDADLALQLSKDYGTDHTEIEISSDIYKENLVKSCEIIEEPNYNISLATYLEVARIEGIHGDGNRVILSGDGGDEVFGGYPLYKKALRFKRISDRTTPLIFNSLKFIREGRYWNYDDPIENWLRSKYFFYGENSRKKISLEYLRNNVPPEWETRTVDPIRDLMYLDRYFWLSGENFIRSDKLYMSESLELRSPLSYAPLRKYFDSRLNYKDYFRGENNKFFMRALYQDKLPDYITKRKDKTGWRSPISMWWNNDYRDLFCDIFSSAPRGSVIDWAKISNEIIKKEKWPGKYFHLYFSLAVLSKKYNLVI